MFLTKNLQLLHITCEIIILCALMFWISSGKKKLFWQIEKLLLRIEEQEEKIQRMELVMEQMNVNNKLLLENINKKIQNLSYPPTPKILTPQRKNYRLPKVVENEEIVKKDETNQSETDSDLDEELREELEELKNEYLQKNNEDVNDVNDVEKLENIENIDTTTILSQNNELKKKNP